MEVLVDGNTEVVMDKLSVENKVYTKGNSILRISDIRGGTFSMTSSSTVLLQAIEGIKLDFDSHSYSNIKSGTKFSRRYDEGDASEFYNMNKCEIGVCIIISVKKSKYIINNSKISQANDRLFMFSAHSIQLNNCEVNAYDSRTVMFSENIISDHLNIHSSTLKGVKCKSDEMLVKDCNIVETEFSGENLRLVHNDIVETVFSGKNLRLVHNSIKNSKSNGIKITGIGGTALISKCDISGNVNTGVQVYDCKKEVIIDDCTVKKNDIGISVGWDAEEVTIRDSIIDNNEVGINIFNDSSAEIVDCIITNNDEYDGVSVGKQDDNYNSSSRSCDPSSAIIRSCVFRGNRYAVSVWSSCGSARVFDSKFESRLPFFIKKEGGDITCLGNNDGYEKCYIESSDESEWLF